MSISGHTAQTAEDLLISIAEKLQKEITPLEIESLENICCHLNIQGHLAILERSYLKKIIDKEKTIESRFHKPRVAPYQRIKAGDALFLKQSAGPLIAVAIAGDVHFFGPLSVGEAVHIMEEFSEGLALDQSFQETKRDSKFVTLIFIEEIVSIQPKLIRKLDRRPWVVLKSDGAIAR